MSRHLDAFGQSFLDATIFSTAGTLTLTSFIAAFHNAVTPTGNNDLAVASGLTSIMFGLITFFSGYFTENTYKDSFVGAAIGHTSGAATGITAGLTMSAMVAFALEELEISEIQINTHAPKQEIVFDKYPQYLTFQNTVIDLPSNQTFTFG